MAARHSSRSAEQSGAEWHHNASNANAIRFGPEEEELEDVCSGALAENPLISGRRGCEQAG